jgi:ubiquinone/menaquinone biosynthesis C-methylase UbiE
MSYESDTREAYRNKTKANAYKNQYIKGFKWARFTMWKQKIIINNYLNICKLGSKDSLLDIPCGAGYVGGILSKHSCSIVASDISIEMMDLAVNEYSSKNFNGFLQSDITNTPFQTNAFKCVVVLALMHRLPKDIRKQVLSEVFRVTNKYVIISYSIESLFQKIKWKLISLIHTKHIPAPASIPLKVIVDELNACGLTILKKKRIVNFLSAKVVFLVKKV